MIAVVRKDLSASLEPIIDPLNGCIEQISYYTYPFGFV